MDVVLVSWYDGEVFMWKQEVKWLMWKQEVKWLMWVELDYELRMWGLRIIVNWIEVLYDWMCVDCVIWNGWLLEMSVLVEELSW